MTNIELAKECGAEVTEYSDNDHCVIFGEVSLPAFVERIRADERERAELDAKRYRDALVWALGAGDDFPTREAGQGAYWWRKELQRHAGFEWDGEKFVDAAMKNEA